MLLLDEPTNPPDAAESVALAGTLPANDYEGTVGDHPRPLLPFDNVAGWIPELDRGEGIPGRKLPSWLEQKDARLAIEASSEAARRKSIEKELEWIRQN